MAGLLIASQAVARAEQRTVLELFTSQGCSSCPPADKLLGELAKDPNIVAISLPIDIWDYLGWKDTLALPGHSVRQRAYAKVRGDREVYTPQIVVNGVMHVLGSDRDAIERVIAETDRNPQVMSLPVLLSTDGGDLTVTVGPAPGKTENAEVWLCPIERAVEVSIGHGENRGSTLTYHNVVRAWRKLGEWGGAPSTWRVPIADIMTGNVDAAAILVQEGTREKPGIILGAGFTPLPAPKPTLNR